MTTETHSLLIYKNGDEIMKTKYTLTTIVCPYCHASKWELKEETKLVKLKGYMIFECVKCHCKLYNEAINTTKKVIKKHKWHKLD